MKLIVGLIFALFLVNCRSLIEADTVLTNTEGTLGIVVCSRGCYQYVLSTTTINKPIFPVNLDKTVQQAAYEYYIRNQGKMASGFPVVFSGILQEDSTTISTPAPNDVPIPQFKARNIELTLMRQR